MKESVKPVGLARWRWPDAEWIIGNGKWASVTHCDVITVMLFETKAEAETAKEFIDKTGCGGGCRRLHEVVNTVTD